MYNKVCNLEIKNRKKCEDESHQSVIPRSEATWGSIMFIAFLTQNNSIQNSGKIILINKVKDYHVAKLLHKCPLGTMTDWEDSFRNKNRVISLIFIIL